MEEKSAPALFFLPKTLDNHLKMPYNFYINIEKEDKMSSVSINSLMSCNVDSVTTIAGEYLDNSLEAAIDSLYSDLSVEDKSKERIEQELNARVVEDASEFIRETMQQLTNALIDKVHNMKPKFVVTAMYYTEKPGNLSSFKVSTLYAESVEE